MKISWVFLILGIIVALCSDKIDKAVNASKRLKKWLIIVCAGLVILTAGLFIDVVNVLKM
ncbi:MAG: hypothetical protein ACOWWO_10560 [Peptococcaceae bacterium]